MDYFLLIRLSMRIESLSHDAKIATKRHILAEAK